MEKFIELVHEKQFLYDKNNPEYKNVVLKEKTWKEIAKVLDSDADICKKKWKGLRDSYFRELKKSKLPSRASLDMVPKWKYFENMDFLRMVVPDRNWPAVRDPLLVETPIIIHPLENCDDSTFHIINNQNDDADIENLTQDSNEINDDKDLFYDKNRHLDDNYTNNIKVEHDTCNSHQVRYYKSRKRQRNDYDNMMQDVQEMIKKHINNGNDEIDLFFSSLSQKTKQANLNNEQLSVLQANLIMFLSKQLKKK